MKKLKIFSIISILLIILIYTCNILEIPKNIILLEGENLKINTFLGINITKKQNNNYVAKQASAQILGSINETKKEEYEVSFLKLIPLKTIEANIIPKTMVVPLGKTIGLKLYTDGVLVVGMAEIKNIENKTMKPYENSKIKEGDRIISIDDKTITCTADLIESVNKSKGNEISIKYIRNEEVLTDNLVPVKTSENEYKLGLWVRDAQARSSEQ